MSNVPLQKINEDVRSFVEVANQGQRGLRVVPLGVAFEVARRSLSATEGETFSVRRFRALSAVSAFVSLTQKNKVLTLSALNTDLLPVAHPASTQRHRMSQFNVLRAQARWFADDVRVADSGVSSLLATLFTESSETPEYAYAAARLSSMTAGGITLSALVAVALGYNDGANGGYWRQQIRDAKGQWAKMFGLASFKVRKSDGKVYRQYGKVVSTDVRNKKARLLTPDGRIAEVGTDALSREVKALLPSAETPDGVSAKPVRSSSEDVIINEQDLITLPSPGGFNSADASANLPEGMDADSVEEVWEDADGNFQVVKGKFRDGEGSEFVVSRLEQGRVVPVGAGKDWADAQKIIDDDEDNFKAGKDAVANLPEGMDFSPSGEEQVAELPEADADTPEGPYKVDRGPYEPRGAGSDVESEGYTDDPADLALQFGPEQLGDALRDAVNDGSGVGRLEYGDDKGSEDVPAEAIYNALKAQGVDADQFLDDVEAGKDVKATIPEGADIPELDEPRGGRYEDAKAIREILGDKLPALLQGLSNRELDALVKSEFDFRSLVDANQDKDVPEGFYKLDDSNYDPTAPIPGAPDDLTPFQLSTVFTPEQLENQLREALTPDAERSGYGKFDLPDSDGESQSFDVPAEAITDALKLHAIDTNELLDEIYGDSEPTPDEVDSIITGEDIDTEDDEAVPAEAPEEADTGGPAVAEEPEEQEELAERPFAEEIVELDVSGDLETQINDAIDNQRELAFAYQGSNDDVVDRIVRPVRLEVNERTGNVNLLAYDDEGNPKKYTLSKMQDSADADSLQDEMVGEDTPGDEIEVDGAELPNTEVFDDARSAVVDEVFETAGAVDTNDVEDLGEQDDVNDSVTTDIVEAVDAEGEEGEAPLSKDEFVKAVADVIKDAVEADDAVIPSLEELLERIGDKDNFDPDLIWQDVIDEFDGTVLPNGHIVVSSVMHGDRRYDVVVRRDAGNNFHVYHRVVYPNGTTKVHEMGKTGWQSTKALFDKVQKQIRNSVERPTTTINKNLKPESDRTLRAAIILPQADDAFVTANGSTVAKGDQVLVVRENHSKFGQQAKIIRAERRFTVDGYRYTDYLRVKYADGEKNWIRSQSVNPAEGAESGGTTEQPAGDVVNAGPELDANTAALDAKQAEGLPDGIFGSIAPDVAGLEALSSDLETLLEFLPNSPKDFGDNNFPDVDVQFTVDTIGSMLRTLKINTNIAGTPRAQRMDDLRILEVAEDNSAALMNKGLNLKDGASASDSPRKDFYLQVGDLLIAAGDDLRGKVDDEVQKLREEYDRNLTEPLPEGTIPTAEILDYDSFRAAVDAIVAKLPPGDRYAIYQGLAQNVANIPGYQKVGASHMDDFVAELRNNQGDILRSNLSDLNSALRVFEGEGASEMGAVISDLKSLRDAIDEAKASRPPRPFSAPGLEEFDALAVREERIEARENIFTADSELPGWVQKSIEGGPITESSILSNFSDELGEFFDGEERSLAELSPRARVALQKTIAHELKYDLGISDSLADNMFELLRKLDVEEQAYTPKRNGVGDDVQALQSLSSVDSIFQAEVGDNILDDNGDPTGWVLAQDDGGGINFTVQLRYEDTGQLLWVKREMSPSYARAEYVGARLNNMLGVAGAPQVELYEEESNVLFITQAGETVDFDAGTDQFSNVFNEYQGIDEAISKVSMLDIIRMGILDVAIENGDRHGGNFLVGQINQLGVGDVQGEDSESIRILPIDHGHSSALNNTITNTSVEDFFTMNMAAGSRLFRALIGELGAERFMNLSFPIVRELLNNIEGELQNNPIYSSQNSFEFSLNEARSRLNEFLALDDSVFVAAGNAR